MIMTNDHIWGLLLWKLSWLLKTHEVDLFRRDGRVKQFFEQWSYVATVR